ncbi:MAG: hypothetical protein KKH88_01085 [Nanoarchaeota archaeon]|nr:hypothetical protein [Nanoarchaeota archaeon]
MKLKFVIDKKYDKKFVNKKYLNLFNDRYKTSMKYLELSKKLYQKSWDEINDQFSKYIEKGTGYKWFYKEYKCVLSVIHSGMSNWGYKPIIIRSWKENPYSMRRITAHELILSHYFEIYKRHYKKEGLTEGQVWALAEISAFALTSLSKDVKKWWPWNTGYYTNHNYPHIVKLQNQLKKPFLELSFDDYIKKGIKLVKKYPEMWPTYAKRKKEKN